MTAFPREQSAACWTTFIVSSGYRLESCAISPAAPARASATWGEILKGFLRFGLLVFLERAGGKGKKGKKEKAGG